MKTLKLFLIALLLIPTYGRTTSREKAPITIGILMPIEHASLRQIVKGFEDTVRTVYPKAQFNLQSAQGDLKLQSSILNLFIGQNVDILVPIGTNATQMALSLHPKNPIVSLAPLLTEAEKQSSTPFTAVLDEIGAKKKIDFIQTLFPKLKVITVIFDNNSEKIHRELEEMTKYAALKNLTIDVSAIHNFGELKAATDAIRSDSEAILILKDHVVASGIRLLVTAAKQRALPLITSDEGSARMGATFGLGVTERKIGEEGGRMALQILQGTPVDKLPAKALEDLTLFYHPHTPVQYPEAFARAKAYAKQHHYECIEANAIGAP